MKRDMDLARKILLDVEQCEETDGFGHFKPSYDGHSLQEVFYHIKLLDEAGLIEVLDLRELSNPRQWPTRLTWAGHEFLDAARDDTRWQKAKRFVIDKTGSLSFELLKQALMKLATDAFG
jgi:hypothetical protein